MNDVERGFLCIFSSQCAAGDTHALCFFLEQKKEKNTWNLVMGNF